MNHVKGCLLVILSLTSSCCLAEPALPQAKLLTQDEGDCLQPLVDFSTAITWDKQGKHVLAEEAKRDPNVEIRYYEKQIVYLQRHLAALKAGKCNSAGNLKR